MDEEKKKLLAQVLALRKENRELRKILKEPVECTPDDELAAEYANKRVEYEKQYLGQFSYWDVVSEHLWVSTRIAFNDGITKGRYEQRKIFSNNCERCLKKSRIKKRNLNV